jgi:hypothetical protein
MLCVYQMIHEYVKQRWNDIDRGKPKNSAEKAVSVHFLLLLSWLYSLVWAFASLMDVIQSQCNFSPGANPGHALFNKHED